jgi:hypothetical protein
VIRELSPRQYQFALMVDRTSVARALACVFGPCKD